MVTLRVENRTAREAVLDRLRTPKTARRLEPDYWAQILPNVHVGPIIVGYEDEPDPFVTEVISFEIDAEAGSEEDAAWTVERFVRDELAEIGTRPAFLSVHAYKR
jgi:hypothetical protein